MPWTRSLASTAKGWAITSTNSSRSRRPRICAFTGPQHWPAISTPPPLPAPLTVEDDDPPAWCPAAGRAVALATAVDADDADGAQLAVDLARVDLHQVDAAPNQLARLLLEAGLLALEADIDLARSS